MHSLINILSRLFHYLFLIFRNFGMNLLFALISAISAIPGGLGNVKTCDIDELNECSRAQSVLTKVKEVVCAKMNAECKPDKSMLR